MPSFFAIFPDSKKPVRSKRTGFFDFQVRGRLLKRSRFVETGAPLLNRRLARSLLTGGLRHWRSRLRGALSALPEGIRCEKTALGFG